MSKLNLATRLHIWLGDIRVKDPIDRRMASLLQVMMLGFMSILVIATIINLFLAPPTNSRLTILVNYAVFLFVVWIPFFLLRRGYFRGAVFAIIAAFIGLETYNILSYDLRSIAETLSLLTLAILLAGLLVGRKGLMITFVLSAAAVLLGVFRQTDPQLKMDGVAIAGNFILLNGLMSLFLGRFDLTLRAALSASLEREKELGNAINFRRQAEAAFEASQARLEVLHEIDRALLAAHSLEEITTSALARIRRLIPCPRASVTLFNLAANEAYFLAVDINGVNQFSEERITTEEYGTRIVATLKQNQPWMIADMLSDPEATALDKELALKTGVHAWLALPLISQGQLIGALNLGRPLGQTFSAQDASTAHDIANQLAVAIHQNNLNDALQEQLHERGKLIAKLEASNAELERFSYTVSHDLRNPLVTIKGFLGMLDRDLKENRVEKIQDDFRRIANAADKMDTLLSELLELSRIGRIVNPPQEIDTARLLQDALESVEARIRSKHVEIRIAPQLPPLYGDRIRLREVFENLIDNAIKYSGNQPGFIIEIGAVHQNDEDIIHVRDNGMGIDPRYHTKIFSLFEKLDSTSEGTGIGLALVKRIIEYHGGRIWVESDGLGSGTTFCFTIPSSALSQSTPQSAPTS